MPHVSMHADGAAAAQCWHAARPAPADRRHGLLPGTAAGSTTPAGDGSTEESSVWYGSYYSILIIVCFLGCCHIVAA